ncbi:MAG: VOC family protein [Anaerolineales bacterium]|nr:VOC family protein [Anaerolineales bacterium]
MEVRKPLSDFLLRTATMLVVNDMEASIAFYRDKFGFKVKELETSIALLERDGMFLYFITESKPTVDKPGVTLANTNGKDKTSVNLVFRVTDCIKAYHELNENGVEFLTPPQSPPWGGWRCFTKDPNGYLIEIEQP